MTATATAAVEAMMTMAAMVRAMAAKKTINYWLKAAEDKAATLAAAEVGDNNNKQDNCPTLTFAPRAMDGDSTLQRPSTTTSCVGHSLGKNKFDDTGFNTKRSFTSPRIVSNTTMEQV
jgi:hypothetical protein